MPRALILVPSALMVSSIPITTAAPDGTKAVTNNTAARPAAAAPTTPRG